MCFEDYYQNVCGTNFAVGCTREALQNVKTNIYCAQNRACTQQSCGCNSCGCGCDCGCNDGCGCNNCGDYDECDF